MSKKLFIATNNADRRAVVPVAAAIAGSGASGAPSGALDARVRGALERIRPAVQADGGDVELVDVVGDTVRVRFRGACVGCPSSSLTLRMGIERTVRDAVPEIKTVVAVS